MDTLNMGLPEGRVGDLLRAALAGERLAAEDALHLFEAADLNELGTAARQLCARQNGNRASYLLNRYINYSNYCILSCQFCAFARKKRDADGFELPVAEVCERGRAAAAAGATELHIVGGLHPSLPFDYYLEMLRALRGIEPRVQLKCFTAIEILHFAWLAKKGVRETLEALREAGLDSLTGGGAEIFNPAVRSRIARGKESAEEYLDVHRTWHRMGGRSTCTMLYGHVESAADRIDHLDRLRRLQDETGGFTGFIPLAYQPGNNGIPRDTPPTGQDTLRTIAISRLFLDNFAHITAYWVGLGTRLAQVALDYGADDLHGTIGEEKIFHMAGATSPQAQTEAEMVKAIIETSRCPVQRDTFYQPIKEWRGDVAEPLPLGSGPAAELLRANLATA